MSLASRSTLLAGLTLFGLAGITAAQAEPIIVPYVVTLKQVGTDVVATGHGEFSLAGLTQNNTDGPVERIPGVDPSHGTITSVDTDYDFFVSGTNTLTGPSSFGIGGTTFGSSWSGSGAGMESLQLLVPGGYGSGGLLTNSETFADTSFADLGITPGTYFWSWGTAADQTFTLQVGPVTVPEPMTATLFAFGLAGATALRRRKRA